MGGEISASPAADQRGVYVATETGKPQGGTRRATGALRVLGREGGVTLWMRTLAMPLRGALTLGNDKLFGGGTDGRVYALRVLLGKQSGRSTTVHRLTPNPSFQVLVFTSAAKTAISSRLTKPLENFFGATERKEPSGDQWRMVTTWSTSDPAMDTSTR